MPRPQSKNHNRGKENNSRTANRSRPSSQKRTKSAAADLRTCPLCNRGGFSPVDLGLHVTDCADLMEKHNQNDDAGAASDVSEELVVTQRHKAVVDDDIDERYTTNDSSDDEEFCVDVPQFVRASQAPGKFKAVVFSDEEDNHEENPAPKATVENNTLNSASKRNSPRADARRRFISDDEGSPVPRPSAAPTADHEVTHKDSTHRHTDAVDHAQVSSMGHTDASQSPPPKSPEGSPVHKKSSRAKTKEAKASTSSKTKSKAKGKTTKALQRNERAEYAPKERAMSEPLVDDHDNAYTDERDMIARENGEDTDYRHTEDMEGDEDDAAGEDDEYMAMLAARTTKPKKVKTSPKSKKKDKSSTKTTKRDMAAAKAEAKEKKKKRKSTGSIPDKRSKKKSRTTDRSKSREHNVVKEGKDGITLTNFPPGDTDWIEQMVKKNNLDHRFDVTSRVTAQTTHVVAGAEPCRRTLNVLRAIAYGCWLVSKNWVFKSYVMGQWQLETEFELQEEYPAAIKERLERELCKAEGVPYQNTLFQDHRFCITPRRTVPPKEDLEELIIACSGQIVKEKSQSTVYVTTTERKPSAAASYHVVSAKWILDSIQKGMLEPFVEEEDDESQRRARRSPEL